VTTAEQHDNRCESELVLEAGAYTPCRCDERALSPVEDHAGLLMKREDLYRYPNGANGAKLRAAEALLEMAHAAGYRKVVTGAACVSPQHALVASAAHRLGMQTTHILGGTTPATATRHTSVNIAVREGAALEFIPVGYNPALVKACRDWAEANSDTYWLHYGISAPPDAMDHELRVFHSRSADQVANLPAGVTDIVLPFGSGNTGAGVLWGLERAGFDGTVRLMEIGPSRREWLHQRLDRLGAADVPFRVVPHTLHGNWATYGDRMPETLDGVEMHPTYEGKIVRYLNTVGPRWWTKPAGRTLLWIVGAPLPRLKGSAS
jgi:hypothetical protein